MDKRMVNGFFFNHAHYTPVSQIPLSTLQVIECKNLIQYHSPQKEAHFGGDIRIPNVWQKNLTAEFTRPRYKRLGRE